MFSVKGTLPISEGELEFKGTLFKDLKDFQTFLIQHANSPEIVGVTAPAYGATLHIRDTSDAIHELTYQQLED